MRQDLVFYIGLAAIALCGCGDDTGAGASGGGGQPSVGGHAEGGQGGALQGGDAAQGGEDQGGGGGGQGGAPTAIEAACGDVCANGQAVIAELDCNPPANPELCVPDCTSGLSDPACELLYLAVLECTAEEATAETCVCAAAGGLECGDICSEQLNEYITCVTS